MRFLLKTFLLLLIAAPLAMACQVRERIWSFRTKTADPLYRVVRHGKVGYIDRNGMVVVDAGALTASPLKCTLRTVLKEDSMASISTVKA